jgi:hypothetical protein
MIVAAAPMEPITIPAMAPVSRDPPPDVPPELLPLGDALGPVEAGDIGPWPIHG